MSQINIIIFAFQFIFDNRLCLVGSCVHRNFTVVFVLLQNSYFRLNIGSSVVDMKLTTLIMFVFEQKRERACVRKKEL